MNKATCPLCKSTTGTDFSKDKKRQYFKCQICKTIFVPPKYHLSESEEKKRYENHTNSIDDPRYTAFLSRIVDPVINRIKTHHKGLDFGCGPGPILRKVFEKHNIVLEEYDLYFKNTKSLLNRKWDFIISTEVIEHLKNPYNELHKIWELLRTGGYLFLMTQLYQPNTEFKSWYYKGDPTHIVFYTKESFTWLAKKFNSSLEFVGNDIIILKKS